MASGSREIAGKVLVEWFMVLFVVVVLCDGQSGQANVLAQCQKLSGSQLISRNTMFTLGFYSPKYSNRSYIGISYNTNSQKPVWIANRNSPFPVNDGSVSLTIDANGSLKIVGKAQDEGYVGYSFSLFDVEEPTNSSAILLDDGNFVLRELNPDGSVKRVLWQSFDHPTDTLLPGMKLGINHKTGSTWSLTSWRSENYPSSGAFTLTINPNNTNQLLILLREGIFWTSGNWRGSSFDFLDFNFNRFSNDNETYFTYFTSYISTTEILLQLRLKDGGILTLNSDRDLCSCRFFEYNDYNNQGLSGLGGCVWKKRHEIIPECRTTIYTYSNPKIGYILGNGSKYKESENLTMFECENICVSDCDCLAYNSMNPDGSGCEIWMKGAEFTFLQGDPRLPNLGFLVRYSLPKRKGKIRVWLRVMIGVVTPATILLLCLIFYVKRRSQIRKVTVKMEKFVYRGMRVISEGFSILRIMIRQIRDGKKNPELQFFDFETIVSATNNFSDDCKLGQGGFGPVYKGSLGDGQEVAIKRLSKNSGQGLVEFKNETILIAKLQHTNLVRLIGCCIYREERLLVYEYLPNKSLDFFLFDPEKKLILDWDKRLHIIQGIIQGLLYLHNYSRVRIIHRDLKVSNILLDDEMNAKISDFGMARVFKPSDNEVNTSRVVGTYGYISPEHVREGIFSIKSDVYSFGILLMEIITGQKNYNNYDTERPLNLIGYAWELWVNGRGEELIDSAICTSNYQKSEALRCIHVSLLCVQQIAADRPTMLDVYFMIHSDSTQLSSPKQPAFFIPQDPRSSEVEAVRSSESALEICSRNTMSLSVRVAR